MGCLSPASSLTTVSSNLSAAGASPVTGTEARAPPSTPPQSCTFPKEGALPIHWPQSMEVLDHAVLLKARFECKQKRFPEGTKKNSQKLLEWFIVMQHVKVSLEDLLKPRKKKGGLMTAPTMGQMCCLWNLTPQHCNPVA